MSLQLLSIVVFIIFSVLSEVKAKLVFQSQTGNNFFEGLSEQTVNKMNMASMFPNCAIVNSMPNMNPGVSSNDNPKGTLINPASRPAFSSLTKRISSKMVLERSSSQIRGRLPYNGPGFGINSIPGQPSSYLGKDINHRHVKKIYFEYECGVRKMAATYLIPSYVNCSSYDCCSTY